MNPITFLKAPIQDFSSYMDIRREMQVDKKALESGEITEQVFKKRKRNNSTKAAIVMTPICTVAAVIVLCTSETVYNSYQGGIPLSELLGTNIDIISEIASNSFQNNPLGESNVLKELSAMNFEKVGEYISYLTTGLKDFFMNMSSQYLNSSYLIATAGAYGLSNGLVKALGFVAGATKGIDNHRLYDQEEMKLNILRKHYQDPIFDTLNNEELFAMSLAFNEVLHQNYKGKKKIFRKMINGLDLCDRVTKLTRRALNKSNNDKDKLMSNVFDYIEQDIDKENIDNSLKKYGISKTEFKAIADQNGVLSDNLKYDYLFGLNKRAMLAAYKRKLKDDMLLTFALKLESYTRGEVSGTDPKFKSHLDNFGKFIQMYSNENKILKREKLPEDLRIVAKIIKIINRNQEVGLKSLKNFPENNNYIDFLAKHAPHMIEKRGENSFFLNNYSFITYYEAERERFAKLDVVKQRLTENRDSMSRNSNSRNRSDYNKKKERSAKLEEDLIDLDDIFFDKHSLRGEERTKEKNVENIFKPEIEKISTVFPDKKIGYEVAIRNYITKKEADKLIGKEAMREKGIEMEHAERAAKIQKEIQSKERAEESFKNRKAFKDRYKNYSKR
jgi:hypothetical protein